MRWSGCGPVRRMRGRRWSRRGSGFNLLNRALAMMALGTSALAA